MANCTISCRANGGLRIEHNGERMLTVVLEGLGGETIHIHGLPASEAARAMRKWLATLPLATVTDESPGGEVAE